MDLKGEYRIPAPRQRVWEMLNDPEVLRACIPGCESLEPEGDGFAAKVTTRIGPVKATFNGAVKLSNMNPPESYTISGEGKGGVAGFASGSCDVHLAEEGAETALTYTADAKVGGKLAQLGSRLIDSTARKMADQFFDKFAELAGAPAGAPAAATAAPAAEEAEPEPAPAEKLPADITSGLVGAEAQMAEATETAVAHIAHEVAEAAHHAEEELEKSAASGVLGGPMVWGLIVLAIIILFLIFAT